MKIVREFENTKNDREEFFNDLDLFFGSAYVVNNYNIGVSTKFAVMLILYYQTLKVLGTEKHRPAIERLLSTEELGCFALTELGHGSDVKGLMTTATYDHQS